MFWAGRWCSASSHMVNAKKACRSTEPCFSRLILFLWLRHLKHPIRRAAVLLQWVLSAKCHRYKPENPKFADTVNLERHNCRCGIIMTEAFSPPRRLSHEQAVRLSLRDHAKIWKARFCNATSLCYQKALKLEPIPPHQTGVWYGLPLRKSPSIWMVPSKAMVSSLGVSQS